MGGKEREGKKPTREREITTVKTRLNRRDDSSAQGRKKGKELPPDQYKIHPTTTTSSIHPSSAESEESQRKRALTDVSGRRNNLIGKRERDGLALFDAFTQLFPPSSIYYTTTGSIWFRPRVKMGGGRTFFFFWWRAARRFWTSWKSTTKERNKKLVFLYSFGFPTFFDARKTEKSQTNNTHKHSKREKKGKTLSTNRLLCAAGCAIKTKTEPQTVKSASCRLKSNPHHVREFLVLPKNKTKNWIRLHRFL